MIRYTPGFAPTTDGVPQKAAETVKSLPLSVEQAKALAAQRETQVLGYSRKATQPLPLKTNLRTDGPTLELWVKSGYEPSAYPPEGYAELPSPALDAFKATQSGQVAGTGGVTHTPHSLNDKPEVPK